MKRAILSVHDKTGVVEFARGLHELGWTLIASGGTAKLLTQSGLPVKEVSDYTGSPEMLGGRVKTLHPAIHGGLLARPTPADEGDLKKQGYGYIDLVAVTLYPFEQTIAKPNVTMEEVIENIDIGGVTLIRAAAKNHERVTLVCDPRDYNAVLSELRTGAVSSETRKRLAIKGFASTAHYDATIAGYLNPEGGHHVQAYTVQKLRYGENPHQAATLYSLQPGGGPLGGRILQGKELSYNNLLDLDAAWRAAVSFERPSVAIVKHLSPCGVASGDDLTTAFKAALASDPISAFGGVIASNKPFDAKTAETLGDLFVECIAAPGFTDDAKALLAKRKQCRLLEMPDTSVEPRHELRSVTRGLLKQDVDFGDPSDAQWKVVSKREPTAAEWTALKFAWKVCAHVKSNAIVFAQGEATVGIGGGQPNRVDCVRIASERAGEKSKGAAMASDAFFPFPDSVQVAAKAGITAVIHPGGSIRDKESIAAADEANMAMVVTGVRHFRH
ncbi:MAG: bifunctional phosphoribosylaminoimidazolecarboxamide formyltransferase/IMP cyclohydrolase [Myxococcota bacterium]